MKERSNSSKNYREGEYCPSRTSGGLAGASLSGKTITIRLAIA
jgi:hypothetical protein